MSIDTLDLVTRLALYAVLALIAYGSLCIVIGPDWLVRLWCLVFGHKQPYAGVANWPVAIYRCTRCGKIVKLL